MHSILNRSYKTPFFLKDISNCHQFAVSFIKHFTHTETLWNHVAFPPNATVKWNQIINLNGIISRDNAVEFIVKLFYTNCDAIRKDLGILPRIPHVANPPPAAGQLITYWDNNNLMHTVISVDGGGYIGANNIGTFGIGSPQAKYSFVTQNIAINHQLAPGIDMKVLNLLVQNNQYHARWRGVRYW